MGVRLIVCLEWCLICMPMCMRILRISVHLYINTKKHLTHMRERAKCRFTDTTSVNNTHMLNGLIAVYEIAFLQVKAMRLVPTKKDTTYLKSARLSCALIGALLVLRPLTTDARICVQASQLACCMGVRSSLGCHAEDGRTETKTPYGDSS